MRKYIEVSESRIVYIDCNLYKIDESTKSVTCNLVPTTLVIIEGDVITKTKINLLMLEKIKEECSGTVDVPVEDWY